MKHAFGIALLLAAFGFTAFAQCSDADKKALEAFDHAWGEASVAGDRAALTKIYADDFAGLPGMVGKAATIDQAIRAAERNKADPAAADKVTYDNYVISCTPNSATITHRNTVWTPHGTGGKPETFYTRSVHFLEKRNGNWQVVSNAGSGLDEYDVVWYLEQDWNTAFMKRDRAWFENNFASDFSNISSSNGSITGKGEELKSMVDDKSTYDVVETKNVDINIDGNVARVTGVFHLKGTDGKGAAFDNNIRYTDIWLKRDGKWWAWSSQGTYMK
jgi:ketosteroid isomerase-like protein